MAMSFWDKLKPAPPAAPTAIHTEVTRDGKVEIALTSASKLLPVTSVCEIWLMRKDKMTWTVRELLIPTSPRQ